MIYVVDDDEEILDLVGDLLHSILLPYKLFSHPKDLLEALASQDNVELFLIDFQMPDINGFELIEKIRKIPGFYHTPVLIFSANTNEDNIIEGLNLGADDYINKPFRNKILLTKIKKSIERGRQDKLNNNNYGFTSLENYIKQIEKNLIFRHPFSLAVFGIQNYSEWKTNLNKEEQEAIKFSFVNEIKKIFFNFSAEFLSTILADNVFALCLCGKSSDYDKEVAIWEEHLLQRREVFEKLLNTFFQPAEINQGYFYVNKANGLKMIPLCRPAVLSLSFSENFSGNAADIQELLISMSRNKIHNKIFQSWKY